MEDKLKKLMAVVFNVNEADIDENSSPDTIPNWDSIHQMSLVAALEDEFNVVITSDRIAEMLNYKLIKLMLTELLEEKSN